MTNPSAIYLGTKTQPAKGQEVAVLRSSFSRLTPQLLGRIPERLLPQMFLDNIVLPEKAIVRVPTEALGNALASLDTTTPVIEARIGAEFQTLTGELKTFGDVVPVIKQALAKGSTSAASTNPNSPVRFGIFAVSQDVVDARGVRAWLDGIDHPEYETEIGMFIYISRFFGSLMDHATVWIPLGIQVVDNVRA